MSQVTVIENSLVSKSASKKTLARKGKWQGRRKGDRKKTIARKENGKKGERETTRKTTKKSN